MALPVATRKKLVRHQTVNLESSSFNISKAQHSVPLSTSSHLLSKTIIIEAILSNNICFSIYFRGLLEPLHTVTRQRQSETSGLFITGPQNTTNYLFALTQTKTDNFRVLNVQGGQQIFNKNQTFLQSLFSVCVSSHRGQTQPRHAGSLTSSLSVRECFCEEVPFAMAARPVGLPGTRRGVLGSSSGIKPMPGPMWFR